MRARGGRRALRDRRRVVRRRRRGFRRGRRRSPGGDRGSVRRRHGSPGISGSPGCVRGQGLGHVRRPGPRRRRLPAGRGSRGVRLRLLAEQVVGERAGDLGGKPVAAARARRGPAWARARTAAHRDARAPRRRPRSGRPAAAPARRPRAGPERGRRAGSSPPSMVPPRDRPATPALDRDPRLRRLLRPGDRLDVRRGGQRRTSTSATSSASRPGSSTAASSPPWRSRWPRSAPSSPSATTASPPRAWRTRRASCARSSRARSTPSPGAATAGARPGCGRWR